MGLTGQADIRVLHVVERCSGGVETYVSDVIRRQRESGRYGAIELAADPRYLDARLAEAVDHVSNYRSGRKPKDMLAAARALRGIVRERAPDLVHLHSSYPGVYGRVCADAGPTAPAIVYCPHGWSFEMDVPELKRRVFRYIERRLLAKHDMLIAISGHEFRGGVSIGAPAEGHVSIPHGVKPPKPGPRPAALDPEFTNILFVGRFGRQKGLDLLLKAFALTNRGDIRLHVLGGPDPGKNADLSKAGPKVQCHGWIDHEEIDAWYAAADALIMPSRWEGFGLVAAEAMRNRLPVLASVRGALPEVLGYGAAGRLFDPEDVAAVARLIDCLNPDVLAALGEAGYARYRAAYMEERAASALEDAYDRALARRKERQ